MLDSPQFAQGKSPAGCALNKAASQATHCNRKAYVILLWLSYERAYCCGKWGSNIPFTYLSLTSPCLWRWLIQAPEGEECMNAQAKNKGEVTRVSSQSQCDTRQEECWSSKMESIYLYISNRFECRYRASSVSPPACRSDTEVQTIAAATNKVSRAPNNAVYIQLSIKAATRGRRRLQEVILPHFIPPICIAAPAMI